MKKKKLNTIAFQTGLYSFISIGLAFTVLVSIFLWTSYVYYSNHLISSNKTNLKMMMSFLEYQITHYQEALQTEAGQTIYVKSVMNPESSRYYMLDYLREQQFHKLKGGYILTTFDGVLISATESAIVKKDPDELSGILLPAAERGELITLTDESEIAFIARVKYNDIVEGYLYYITTIDEIFRANSFIWKNSLDSESITVYRGDKVLIQGNFVADSISSEYPLTILPLKIEIATPHSIIEDSIRNLFYRLIVTSLSSVILLSFIIAILISRKIVSPLQNLEKSIKLAGTGKWQQLDENENLPNEIVFLNRSFNSMENSLIETMNDLEETHNRMLQSEKMASIGLLAAGVAHEINNPVGYINNNLTTMAEYIDVYESVFKIIERIKEHSAEGEGIEQLLADFDSLAEEEDLDFLREDSPILLKESIDGARRIKDIVYRLRIYARPVEEKMTKENISEIIENALKLAYNEIKYNCTVRKELESIPPFMCRADQLTQVLINLFVNAAHAIENQGVITIRTSGNGGELVLEVCDTGKGIDKKILSRIFDPFYTTKDVGKGTGLGLSISRGIIENHGGSIEVTSTPGEGSCFKIRLPMTHGDQNDDR